MGKSQPSHFAVEKNYMHLLWIEPQTNHESGNGLDYTIPPHVVFEENESLCMHINMDLRKYVETESRQMMYRHNSMRRRYKRRLDEENF